MCKVTHEPPKDLVQSVYESSHEAPDLAAVPNKNSLHAGGGAGSELVQNVLGSRWLL